MVKGGGPAVIREMWERGKEERVWLGSQCDVRVRKAEVGLAVCDGFQKAACLCAGLGM